MEPRPKTKELQPIGVQLNIIRGSTVDKPMYVPHTSRYTLSTET